MNTSFFFGWKAAILSAISSRAVNLPRRENAKLGVMNEEQKLDDKTNNEITFALNLPSPFSALGLDPYSPVIQSQLLLFNKGSFKTPWVGRTCRTLSLQVDPKHFSSEIQAPRPRGTSTFSRSATSPWLQPAATIIYKIFEGKLLFVGCGH